ncbi:hypothetical protein EX30DRAFT_232451 [Ascodesmis nigricans]|uniref:Uncharacterized protein n=1 Tax=Ascodesmis nigricans TaxID=341454 RepID=A0A4S2MYH6_9PEZI|nr:hypothetical protein EX30DRAFT_232451 [Ascodesmis nigricans]
MLQHQPGDVPTGMYGQQQPNQHHTRLLHQRKAPRVLVQSLELDLTTKITETTQLSIHTMDASLSGLSAFRLRAPTIGPSIRSRLLCGDPIFQPSQATSIQVSGVGSGSTQFTHQDTHQDTTIARSFWGQFPLPLRCRSYTVGHKIYIDHPQTQRIRSPSDVHNPEEGRAECIQTQGLRRVN